jgi:uncharacterized membrane protein YidH (DUF202 family)
MKPESKDDLYFGTAFIVFEKPIDVYYVLEAYERSPLSRLWRFIMRKLFCCCISKESTMHYRFERAPEPTDVYWENLSVTGLHLIKNVIKTYFFTFCLIAACFGVIYGINVVKYDLLTQNNLTNVPYTLIKGLSFVCSLVIVVVNMALRSVVRNFSLMEKQDTLTAYNLSVAFKLILARFLNSAIVPIIVNYNSSRWFVDGGHCSDMFYVMISISYVDPFLYFFDPTYLVRKCKRWN